MEEHRQAERLQRQLQQEQAYLLSLQHDHRRPHPQPPPQQQQPPQDRSKPSYHAPEPKPHYDPADRAREVSSSFTCCLNVGPEQAPRRPSRLAHECQTGPVNLPLFSMGVPRFTNVRGVGSQTTRRSAWYHHPLACE